MPDSILQLSAGNGPIEVRRFVADLSQLAIATLAERVLGDVTRGDADAPGSVELLLRGTAALDAWCGVHVLISAERGPRARRRWFASGKRFELPTSYAAVDPNDVTFEAVRASGPGGQNVNRRCSAVRLVHRPTGLALRSQTERSQARNRAAAMARLAATLAHHSAECEAEARAARRLAHHHLRRGAPDHHWHRDGRGRLHRKHDP